MHSRLRDRQASAAQVIRRRLCRDGDILNSRIDEAFDLRKNFLETRAVSRRHHLGRQA